MRIHSIELRNIKSYALARVEFGEGVNAIVGLNGAGKSTLLESIGFALFDSLDYKQGLFLREGATDGTVVVAFESSVDGRSYEVRRGVGAGAGYVIHDIEMGARLCSGAVDVPRFLREQMGLAPTSKLEQLFRDAVGVPQGTLTATFLQQPAQRKAVFDPLLHVEEYQKAFTALLEPARALERRIGDLNVQVAHFQGVLLQLPELTTRASAVTVEIAANAQLQVETKAMRERAIVERTRLEALQAEALAADSRKNDAAHGLQAARGQVSYAEALLDESERSVAVVKTNQAGHDRYVGGQARRQALEGRIKERQALELERALAEADGQRAAQEQAVAHRHLEEIASSEQALFELEPQVERQTTLEKQRDHLLAQVAVRDGAARNLAQNRAAYQEEVTRRDQLQKQRAALSSLEAELAAIAARQLVHDEETERLTDERATILGEGKHINEMIENASRAEGAAVCPVCQQPLGPDHVHSLLERYNNQREQMRRRWSEVDSQLKAKQADAQTITAERLDVDARRHKIPPQEVVEQAAQNVQNLAALLAEDERRLAEVAGAADALQATEAQLKALGNPRAARDHHRLIVAKKGAAQADWESAENSVEQATRRAQELLAQVQIYTGADDELHALDAQMAQDLPAYQAVLGHTVAAELAATRQETLARARVVQTEAEAVFARAEAEAARAASHSDPAALAGARGETERLQGVTGGLAQKAQTLADEQATLHVRLAELRTQEETLDGLRLERTNLQDQERHLGKMRSAIKAAGPKVTQTLIQRIGERAAQFFSELTGDYARSLQWNEDYGISLAVDGRLREFKSLSGGEQMVAALAVRLALLREMSTIDVAFFDEPTAHLDEQRREALANQIMGVKGFRQIFVISHDTAFEHLTDTVVRVERANGVSRVLA